MTRPGSVVTGHCPFASAVIARRKPRYDLALGWRKTSGSIKLREVVGEEQVSYVPVLL